MTPPDIQAAIRRAAGPTGSAPLVALADLVTTYFAALDRHNAATLDELGELRVADDALLAAEAALREVVGTLIEARIERALRTLGAEREPRAGWDAHVLVTAGADRPRRGWIVIRYLRELIRDCWPELLILAGVVVASGFAVASLALEWHGWLGFAPLVAMAAICIAAVWRSEWRRNRR